MISGLVSADTIGRPASMFAAVLRSAPKRPVGHHSPGKYLRSPVSVKVDELSPARGIEVGLKVYIQYVPDPSVVILRGHSTVTRREMAMDISPTGKVRIPCASERIWL